MINQNNTQKNTNVSVGKKTKSEIYLKKNELPKNVSSFTNDAGYISQSALNSWLNNHDYIPVSNIKELINKAYPVIESQHNDDTTVIRNIKGEIVAIKDKLNDTESKFIWDETEYDEI